MKKLILIFLVALVGLYSEAQVYRSLLANSIGDQNQELTVLSGFSASNYYGGGSSVPQANTTGFTCWFICNLTVDAQNQVLFGRPNAFGNSLTQGWAIESIAGGLRFVVGTGSSRVSSGNIGVAGNEVGKYSVLHGVVKDGFVTFYKNGVKIGTSNAISSYGTVTANGRIGGNAGSEYFRGGAYVAGICSSTGLSDAQVQSHYQAILTDAYAQPTGCTNLWRSIDEAATWGDFVGGINLTRNGTITKTIVEYNFYDMFNPDDYSSSSTPLSPQISNVAGNLECAPLGNSRTAGVGGSDTDSYRNGVTAAVVGTDISNLNFVGPNSSTASDPQHNGNAGWTAGNHNTGIDLQPSISSVMSTYDPEMVIVWIGTNSTSSDAALETGKTDYLTLIRSIYTHDSNTRIVVIDEAIRGEAFPNARIYDYNYWLWNTAWPTLEAEGCKLIKVKVSNLFVVSTDYADSVHPNDTGYAKLVTPITNALLLAAGYTP